MDEVNEQSSAFGKLLLSHRRAAGLSQAALARLAGVSIRALRDLERGRAQGAKQRSAEVLAAALTLAGTQRELFLAAAKEGRRRVPNLSAAALCALPPRVQSLVGRVRDLARLRAEATAGGVVAVIGPPGVGKTSLAVAAAYELSHRFPDGCFFVDMRGMDDQPLAVRGALDRLLRALGVTPAQIPASEPEQASLLRVLLDSRRVLVVLDNATDEAHVRPLLATGRGCLTLITCRRALGGLEHVRRLWLDPLSRAAAVELLSVTVGSARVEAEPEVAAELVRLCGHLPLAVRIAANRLANRPHWSFAYLVNELRDARLRLSSLSSGDLQVRSAFEISYRRLSAAARVLFRRLAAVPGPDFGIELAEVVSAATEPQVRLHLEELAEANLVQATQTTGRFQFHDLIRIYAAERLEADEQVAARERLTGAVLDHLLGTAIAAGREFFPDARENHQFASKDEAAGWLDLEAGNWQAAQELAMRLGREHDVLELAKAMHWYSDTRFMRHPWDRIFGLGVAAARTLGSRRDLATLLNFLGWARRDRGDDEPVLRTHQEALAVAQEVDDRQEQAWAHAYLGTTLMRLGRFEEAREQALESTRLAEEFGWWSMQAPLRYRLGRVLRATGCCDEALAVLQQLIEDAERHRDGASPESRRWMIGFVVEEIAHTLKELKQWRRAAESYREARTAYTSYTAGDRAHLAATIAFHEGTAWREAGEYPKARECLNLALDALTEQNVSLRREEVLAELERIPSSPGR
ncbi:transcriptional regulator, XRE family protein [Amycolatopsis balhimycina DSM 5908]|uniref:Transcriptional regulator, XRE family protein n=1 Tax=Amycolatopsis balhimycina DSM 5908 TaxID=1081091 RepID=A0A428WP62_AMYBA|nr:XRE family transcriptional regulator [Amycolatopsis balhimycina]RSM44849.1 transcriptional regulator, XRE family protein [Amycolatopsis balhimycina DSM 5908]